jgi:hypothetical protein
MVELLDGMPEGTVGFRVAGDVDREDYTEILRPGLEKAFAAGTGLRTLYLIEDLDEIEAAALWEDTKLGYEAIVKHHGEWERSAIVTDIHWMARATKVFAWMIPGEARVYPTAELEQAKAWVARG